MLNWQHARVNRESGRSRSADCSHGSTSDVRDSAFLSRSLLFLLVVSCRLEKELPRFKNNIHCLFSVFPLNINLILIPSLPCRVKIRQGPAAGWQENEHVINLSLIFLMFSSPFRSTDYQYQQTARDLHNHRHRKSLKEKDKCLKGTNINRKSFDNSSNVSKQFWFNFSIGNLGFTTTKCLQFANRNLLSSLKVSCWVMSWQLFRSYTRRSVQIFWQQINWFCSRKWKKNNFFISQQSLKQRVIISQFPCH